MMKMKNDENDEKKMKKKDDEMDKNCTDSSILIVTIQTKIYQMR